MVVVASPSPRRPWVWLPQHCTVRSLPSAQATELPTPTASKVPVRFLTAVGVWVWVLGPIAMLVPSWPCSLLPQHITLPVVVSAQALVWPTETEATVVPSAVILVGVRTLFVVLATPVWPDALNPQQYTSFKALTAQVLPLEPAETERQLVAVPTRTGELLCVVLPRPSCPSAFLPQHHSDPSVSTAQVWCDPAERAPASCASGRSTRVSPMSAVAGSDMATRPVRSRVTSAIACQICDVVAAD